MYAPACGGREVPWGPNAGPPIQGRPEKKVYTCGGTGVPSGPTAGPTIPGRPVKKVYPGSAAAPRLPGHPKRKVYLGIILSEKCRVILTEEYP